MLQHKELTIPSSRSRYLAEMAGWRAQLRHGQTFLSAVPHLLVPGQGVTDDPVGMTDGVVKNGIRFSGMPVFDHKLSDEQIWQVSPLLRNANKLPQPVQDALRQQAAS